MSISRQQRRAAERKATKRRAVRLAAGAALALGTALVPESAQAATFTVSNTNDSGANSLRDAIAAANAAAGADTIDFTTTGTITLTTGEIVISESLTIDGPGSSSLTVSGNDSSRIFNITDGSAGTLQNVSIEGLTLTAGLTTGQGGALASRENLTITNAVITGNAAYSGGGFYHTDGALILTNVEVSSNEAEARAGIQCREVPSATLSNVRVLDNIALNFEGGVGFSTIGTLLIEDSTIAGNEAQAVAGGILFAVSEAAPAIIRNTTISGNTGTQWAGGLRVDGVTTLTIENSTVSGNVTGTDEEFGFRNGGGLYLGVVALTLRNSTVSGNSAGGAGGNIVLYSSETAVTIEDSIVANGSSPLHPDIYVKDGGTLTVDYSLVETPPPGMAGSNNITGVDPQLSPLQSNGDEPTETHLPSGLGPAIDAGNPAFTGASTDQRGYPRVANSIVDMGAVEAQSILSLSSATFSASENGGTLTFTVERTGGATSDVSVDYETSDGTALDGVDYDMAGGDLVWFGSDVSSRNRTVTILNDSVFEGDETFTITLSSPGQGSTIGIASAVATITDTDDEPPAISIGDVTKAEGSSGTTAFTFPVTLSKTSSETVTVAFTTANGSATAGSDYTAASGTVTFDPGETAENIVVQVNGDTGNEPTETFTVTLSSPVNATIADDSATGTIQNDDVSWIVTNTNDSGAGSLREMVEVANLVPGTNTITFGVTGTITLTSGQLLITESLIIDGPGAASLTISGNDDSRIFEAHDGSFGTLQNVAIEGLTLTDGAEDGTGGAIRSVENLTITDSIIRDSQASGGGGIYAQVGTVTLSGVQLTNNTATGDGGGAVFVETETFTIEDATISGNTAARGGGLNLSSATDDAPGTIRESTISGNSSESRGGGVYTSSSTLVVENSTVSGNVSGTDSGSSYKSGGGFYFYASGSATLKNTTVSGNTSPVAGGNIAGASSLTIESSIVANGSAPANPDIKIGGGSVTANYSLIETPPAGLGGANNVTGVDPQLGPLQDNGGSTQTHLPGGSSAAINAGDPAFGSSPSTDQRGFARIVGGRIDIGSVEVPIILSLSSATYSVAENGGTLTVTVNRTNGSGAVSVGYATSNGTAVAGSDYTAASGTLNWADGDTAAKTFSVTILNDSVFEGSQTFNVTLSSPGGGATLGTSAAVATITDNETQPTISIGNVSASEGNSGTTNFTFAVTLSGASAQTITAGYATAAGTASAGSDYTTASGTLTFNAGVTSQNVVVAVAGDTTVEADETFTVALSSPSNATIATGTGTGTIQSDDASAFGAPQVFSAITLSASQVRVSWAPVSGATSYEIHRATSITAGYSLLTTTSNTTHIDAAVSANTTYLYKVRAIGSETSAFSVDAATTIIFTDATLSSAIRVKRTHLLELRTAVNAMRIAAGLSAFTFTDSTITAQSTRVKRLHITELRTALDAARSAIGLTALSYTDPTITAGSTRLKAAHVTELRAGAG